MSRGRQSPSADSANLVVEHRRRALDSLEQHRSPDPLRAVHHLRGVLRTCRGHVPALTAPRTRQHLAARQRAARAARAERRVARLAEHLRRGESCELELWCLCVWCLCVKTAVNGEDKVVCVVSVCE